jgi:branched-chain amino acid transport system permease protein
MTDLIQLCLSGISLGMIYAMLAFGYGITFSTSRTINFAQGDFLMLGGLTAYSLTVRNHTSSSGWRSSIWPSGRRCACDRR